jgi:hypothetical protein
MAMTILSLNTEHNKVDETMNTPLRKLVDNPEVSPMHGSLDQPATSVRARLEALEPIGHVVNGSLAPAKPAPPAGPANFASNIAQSLVGAFDDLGQHLAEENQRVNASVQVQLKQMQETVDSLKDVWAPVEQLMTAVSEQRRASVATIERLDRLSAIMASLQESEVRKRGELETLRSENRELRAAVGSHGDELTTLKTTLSDTSRRVAGMVELLDKQADVLSQLHQVEANRAAVLERAFADLVRAKSVAA